MNLSYEQQELVKKLKSYIKTFTISHNQYFVEVEAREADLNWEASRFWANVIHKAIPRRYEHNYESLLFFQKEYEATNSVVIDINKLFSKFWLRNVLGYINIPGAISSACRDFDKIEELKNELHFLCHFYSTIPEDKRKTIEKSFFEKEIEKYVKEQNISLNTERIYKQNWLSEKEGIIELSDIDIYFKPYLDYWVDFKFINTLLKQFQDEPEGIHINKSDFENIHTHFGNLYPTVPTIDEFVKQSVLKSNDGLFFINFHNTKIQYWYELSDKIASYYWELLINDKSKNSDEDRIRTFLSKIKHWNSSSDALSHVSNAAKKRFLNAVFELIQNEPDIIGIDNEFQKVRIDKAMSNGITDVFYDRSKYEDFSLNNSNLFELFEGLNNWERKANTTYLYDQSSRHHLSYLIRLIVKHDYEIEHVDGVEEDNPQIFHY